MPKPKSSPNLHNLPTFLSSFIGREREVTELRQHLFSNRLITLTGAGGSGKTRLAIKVAQETTGGFEDGVWLVELASITDSALVAQAIASTLGVREESGRSMMDMLMDHLAARRALLVIDNCEHLISACAEFIETVLQKCPDLKILATSREVLGITGEVVWSVPPLSLPTEQPWMNPVSPQDALKHYKESESVQLFAMRAAAYSPGFVLTADNGVWVAEICRRLDGMPLAIELAGARVRTLSVQEIAARLDDRFHLLTGGSRTAPLRHQTLAATLDWSYTLLSTAEQKVLQRLAVFAGGATLHAAESVCAVKEIESARVLDTLSLLVDKSLVLADKSERGETRYRLLETIRSYAIDKLSEDAEETRNLHLDYFIQWAENADLQLSGTDQLLWLELYEAEHDNLRAALEWCKADEKKADKGFRLAVACSHFWRLRGYLTEGRAQLSGALSRVNPLERNEARAQALFWGASLAYLQSDYPATRVMGEESLSIWRELGFTRSRRLADILDLLGELATEEGDYETAPNLFEEALGIFKELDEPNGIGDMHMQLGWAYMRMGHYEKVALHMEEALALFRQVDNEALVGFALSGLGELAIRQGHYDHAARFLEESLAMRRKHGHKWGMGASLGSLGWVALQRHDFEKMRKYLGQSLSIRMEIGDKGGIAWCLEKLAEAKYDEGQLEYAAKIFGHAEYLRAPLRSVIDPADQPNYERLISDLRSALGTDTIASLWANGKRMQLEDIIDCALSEPESKIESIQSEKEKFGGLTAREREVAALIAQGKSNREIAETMTVGMKTIETYVTRILNKLGFDSRVQIATWAMEKGLK